MNKTIIVKKENNNYYLIYNDIKEKAYIGKNGITNHKKEGDNKTPKGLFAIGLIFGTHSKEELNLDSSLYYQKINNNLHWIDDINSEYYNTLIDVSKTKTNFSSSEHLIDYKEAYEYAIEIKTNPNNIKGKGSAIFLHCTTNKEYTAGCVAIPSKALKKLLTMINKDTQILIE